MRLLFKKHVIKNVFILGMGVTDHDNIIDNIENEKEYSFPGILFKN